jgi:hypothetical protein
MRQAGRFADAGSDEGGPWLGDPPATAGDWELLFDAVAERLHQGLCTPATCPSAQREALLECGRALELLHAGLAAERAQARHADARLQEICAALLKARIEIADLQGAQRRANVAAQPDAAPRLASSAGPVRDTSTP